MGSGRNRTELDLGCREDVEVRDFFLIPVCFKLPEDDLKKIETCRSISVFYVTAYILIFVHVLVLNIKFFSGMRLNYDAFVTYA